MIKIEIWFLRPTNTFDELRRGKKKRGKEKGWLTKKKNRS